MSDRLFDPTRVYDDAASAPHTPGQRMMDHRGYEFTFILANAADITQHHTCVIISNGTQARHTTTGAADVGRLCGVPFVSIPRRSLGWLCIWGAGLINVAASALRTRTCTRRAPAAGLTTLPLASPESRISD